MRYNAVYSQYCGNRSLLSFGIACSKCYAQVDIGDSYCRRCGHKLEPLPPKISNDVACQILTEVVKGNVKVPGVVVEDKSEESKKKEAKEAGPEYWTPDKRRKGRKKVEQ